MFTVNFTAEITSYDFITTHLSYNKSAKKLLASNNVFSRSSSDFLEENRIRSSLKHLSINIIFSKSSRKSRASNSFYTGRVWLYCNRVLLTKWSGSVASPQIVICVSDSWLWQHFSYVFSTLLQANIFYKIDHLFCLMSTISLPHLLSEKFA